MPGPDPQFSTDDVLAIFEEGPDTCEPYNAPEIADILDCHRNTARNYLEDLVALGDLRSKKLGATRVYWRPRE